MNPEIGDIIDGRDVPSIGNFVLSLGLRTKRGTTEVMYYIITSRVYAVFPNILDFFNDCLSRKYHRFPILFPKEKGKTKITPHGRLCDAFFLDKQSHYDTCLDVDSMVVINQNPEITDLETFNQWHSNNMLVHRSRLEQGDLVRCMEMIKLSSNISGENRAYICKNYNEFKRNKAKTRS